MNLEAVIKRAEKAIKRYEAREKQAKVLTCTTGIPPAGFVGLLVVYDFSE